MQKMSVALEPTACNCLALRQAARHVSQIYDAHLALVGLRTTQYSILAKLKRLGPLSINELANSMVMDRTTLGRAIRHWSVTSYWRSEQATMAAPAAFVSRLQAPQGSKLRPRNGARHSRNLKQPSVRTTPRN